MSADGLDPAVVFGGLVEREVSAFAGVPCSQLDGLVRHAGRDARYVPASSEGEAVAVAAGAWLGGGLGAALMQNSGLGNAVNPLTSLVHTFRLPLVLCVSHRGHDGKDAPQHELMGRITLPLLDLLEVPWRALPRDTDELGATLDWVVGTARERMGAAALVVTPGTLASAADVDHGSSTPGGAAHASTPGRDDRSVAAVAERPTRLDALRALVAGLRDDDLVLATTGMTARELAHVADRPGSFGMVGSMGCATGLGLGVARARPERRVVVVDGDGALLMKLGSLATVAHCAPRRFVHVVLDNGCYESTGAQPCASAGVDFVGLARAAGYADAAGLHGAADLTAALARPSTGPVLYHLPIASGRAGVGRVPRAPHAVRDAFRAEACR